ncbi:sulfite oxidase heme-binding subunit YedZ [Methylobacterium iners]|uniref:Protein-methionine-sulfoxide reductase heme-binding subunit MsrQ n=1 Tax=Methylobacterium iners TaxID=418707 RepID=A0ABQ4RUY2_9HYPH|nr:ferric reductase-like transmembrane domain-containing protein [Methylobacterium iners]GJD93782.1 Protein-methionine-sulfoxide reductase heme-binding subunit MsrQ [Methylobacterium iners]
MPPALAFPWRDRAGRFSALKLATFVLALAPGLWLAGAYALDALGAKPITALTHGTGDWAIRFLLLSLAVTPLRRIGNWPRLILVRRMLGLTVLAYALAHLALYVVDQNFILSKVVSEIALRIYLTIGFVALLGLVVLGLTSTDAAIRRMGPAWNRLHMLVYGIAVLGMIHYFLQTKIDVSMPVFWTGLLLLLLGWRAMQRFGIATKPLTLLGLAVATAVLTALLEAAWYGVKSGVPAAAVLGANLEFAYSIRPAWWVLACGLALPVVNLLRPMPARRNPEPRPAVRPAQPALAAE